MVMVVVLINDPSATDEDAETEQSAETGWSRGGGGCAWRKHEWTADALNAVGTHLKRQGSNMSVTEMYDWNENTWQKDNAPKVDVTGDGVTKENKILLNM